MSAPSACILAAIARSAAAAAVVRRAVHGQGGVLVAEDAEVYEDLAGVGDGDD